MLVRWKQVDDLWGFLASHSYQITKPPVPGRDLVPKKQDGKFLKNNVWHIYLLTIYMWTCTHPNTHINKKFYHFNWEKICRAPKNTTPEVLLPEILLIDSLEESSWKYQQHKYENRSWHNPWFSRLLVHQQKFFIMSSMPLPDFKCSSYPELW